MSRYALCAAASAALFVSGCVGRFETAYPDPADPAVSRSWTVEDVRVVVPDFLRLNEDDVLAPRGDIVWHGEPAGERRDQVAAILAEGLRAGAEGLDGDREVILYAQLRRFHGVTPVAVAASPAAVHDIAYFLWVLDARDGTPLAGPLPVDADLPAATRSPAIVALFGGESDRARIVAHIAAVTEGWLGTGPDPRTSFVSIGR